MRREVRILSCLLLASMSWTLCAQEATDSPEATFFRETLVQDIATAGFYELIAWLETLELSTRGDRDALAERLYDFYDLTEQELESYASRTGPDGATPPLVVDSASRTRYFTLDEIDERYIRLSGGVLLTLRDDERGAVHRIRADEITFNQEQDTLAASGAVVYTLERGGSTEQFTGEALTVELGDWSGAFVEGVTERERTIEGEAIDFSFAGSYITRSRDDVIVLEDGRITSSEATPPNYHIRAQKIWVLAPGEWGLRDAFLYVGRVPVFYFPFFFRPGNELFFNPAVGSRARSGNYVQTTTYLMGSPDDRTSAFSLLQLAEEQGPQSEREIEGLFLVPVETPVEGPERGDATVRVLADVYAKLGAYVATDVALAELGPLRQLEFYAALAASRHIYVTDYPGAGSAYTPYYVAGGEARQSWNVTDIGPVTVPFRFGLTLATRTALQRVTADLHFELYSDTRFRTDFEERSEQIDWLGLLGQGTQTTTPGPVSSLRWQLAASYRADPSDLARVSQLSLQRAVVGLNWRSRTIDPALLPDEVVMADDSPEATFFYPESMRLPELGATVSGTLFEYPRPPQVAAEDDDGAVREDVVAPWDEQREDSSSNDTETHDHALPIEVPGIQSALPSPELPEPVTARVRYSLAPTLIVDRSFLDEEWQQPSDVDFGIAYGGASARLAGSLRYGAGLSAELVRVDGSLASTGQYRTVFDRDPAFPAENWTSLRQQAWSFTSFTATNNLTVSALPLRYSRRWSGSSVAYTANTLLYQVVFDEVVGDEPQWRSDSIGWDETYFRRHQLKATAAFDTGGRQSLEFTAALPPRRQQYNGRLSLAAEPLSATVGAGIGRPDETWVFEPLTASATLSPWNEVALANTLSYNLEADELTFTRASLNAGPVAGELEWRTTQGYTFGGLGVGWQGDDDPRLRPSSARMSLSVDSDFDPFWKNRVIADLGVAASWNSSLIRFTESSFRVVFSGDLLIHRLLRLSLETTSVNSQGYVYFKPMAQAVGRAPRNLFLDLLRSFNVFDRTDRVESGFNLQSVRLSALHDLGDWELTVGYTGRPELDTAEDGSRFYQWRATLDINLQWRPIKELATAIRVDPEQITFGSDS